MRFAQSIALTVRMALPWLCLTHYVTVMVIIAVSRWWENCNVNKVVITAIYVSIETYAFSSTVQSIVYKSASVQSQIVKVYEFQVRLGMRCMLLRSRFHRIKWGLKKLGKFVVYYFLFNNKAHWPEVKKSIFSSEMSKVRLIIKVYWTHSSNVSVRGDKFTRRAKHTRWSMSLSLVRKIIS